MIHQNSSLHLHRKQRLGLNVWLVVKEPSVVSAHNKIWGRIRKRTTGLINYSIHMMVWKQHRVHLNTLLSEGLTKFKSWTELGWFVLFHLNSNWASHLESTVIRDSTDLNEIIPGQVQITEVGCRNWWRKDWSEHEQDRFEHHSCVD